MKVSRISEFTVVGPPPKRNCRSDNKVKNQLTGLMYTPNNILHFIAKNISNQDQRIESRILAKLSTVILCEYLKTLKNYNVKSNFDVYSKEREILTCTCCMELLYSPITLRCGHSFCKKCISNDLESSMTTCVTCKMAIGSKNEAFRPNVIITSALLKCCPVDMKGRKLTTEGLYFYSEKRYANAIEKFNEALAITPTSHQATFHRAKAHFHLENYVEALNDTIRATYLVPKWPEAHFLKAEIWCKLNYYEDALFSMLVSYGLQCSNDKIKRRLRQLIKITSDSKFSKEACLSSPVAFQSGDFTPSFRSNKNYGQKLFNFTPEESVGVTPLPSDIGWKDGSTSHCGFLSEFDNLSCSSRNTSASLPLFQSQYKNANKFGFLKRKAQSTKGIFAGNCIIDNPICLKGIQNLCSSIVHNDCTLPVNNGGKTFTDNFQFSLLDPSDFTCSLCTSVFYDPVCTPCGHVYCHACLDRALDYKPVCPNCKRSLSAYISETIKSKQSDRDAITQYLLRTHLPDDFSMRGLNHREDISELKEMQPIFVCTIAFPSMPCPLHVFEPRYKLMLRRCFSYNDREFGMCMPGKNKPHSTVGTLLKVRDVTFFDDGRSIVDCIGFRRFITSNTEKKDGYNVATLSFIVDEKVTEETAVNELLQLIDTTYNSANTWFNELPHAVKLTVVQNYGEFPSKDGNVNTENGPNWLWWVLAVVPVNNLIKLKILGSNVLKDRLRLLTRIFICLKSRKTKT